MHYWNFTSIVNKQPIQCVYYHIYMMEIYTNMVNNDHMYMIEILHLSLIRSIYSGYVIICAWLKFTPIWWTMIQCVSHNMYMTEILHLVLISSLYNVYVIICIWLKFTPIWWTVIQCVSHNMCIIEILHLLLISNLYSVYTIIFTWWKFTPIWWTMIICTWLKFYIYL